MLKNNITELTIIALNRLKQCLIFVISCFIIFGDLISIEAMEIKTPTINISPSKIRIATFNVSMEAINYATRESKEKLNFTGNELTQALRNDHQQINVIRLSALILL